MQVWIEEIGRDMEQLQDAPFLLPPLHGAEINWHNLNFSYKLHYVSSSTSEEWDEEEIERKEMKRKEENNGKVGWGRDEENGDEKDGEGNTGKVFLSPLVAVTLVASSEEALSLSKTPTNPSLLNWNCLSI